MRVFSRSAVAAVAMAALSGLAIAADDESRFAQPPSVPGGGGSPIEAVYAEGFDNIAANGWTYQNLSVPLGTTNYFQGNPAVFAAHSGAANSYLGTNFNNTTGNNTISNWAYSPVNNVAAGEVVSFWTRTVSAPAFPDRLHLKYDPTGSTNAANYTNTLVTVNPNLTLAGYPSVWTQFSFVMTAALASPTGRFAFHYDVPGGGPSGANSDYIGIDTFSIVPEPASLGLIGLVGVGLLARRRA
jgi:hypothetical protein